MLARRPVSTQAVVAAFHGAGIDLHSFPAPGQPPQYVAAVGGLNPGVVVLVFPDEGAARRAEQTLAINGRRIRAVAVRNVRIWVAAGAPHDLRRRVSRAMAAVKRA